MATKKESYFACLFRAFADSFRRIDHKIFFILLFDLAFFAALVFLLAYFQNALITSVGSFDFKSLSAGSMATRDSAQGLLSSLQGLLVFIVAVVSLMIISTIAVTTIFQGIAWSIARKTNLSMKFFLKFFLLNCMIIGIYSLVIIILALIFTTDALAVWFVPVFLVFLHFAVVLYAYFIKEPSKKTVESAFRASFTSLHKLIMPYIMLAVIFFGLFIAMKAAILIPQQGIGASIIAVLFVIYIAWARFFIIEVIDNCL